MWDNLKIKEINRKELEFRKRKEDFWKREDKRREFESL